MLAAYQGDSRSLRNAVCVSTKTSYHLTRAGRRAMSVITLEGITDNGQIRLKTKVRLPDNIKVYVVIPDIEIEGVAHVYSPRLADPNQKADVQMEIIEESPGGGVPTRPSRTAGLHMGAIQASDDFDEPLTEEF